MTIQVFQRGLELSQAAAQSAAFVLRETIARHGKVRIIAATGASQFGFLHSDALIATPINLGSSEMASINTLLTKIEKIADVKMSRKYDLNAPQGVAGRNSDNTFIKKTLNWEPNTKLDKGLAETYAWIKHQYKKRKAGERVGIG